jgi:hypothetical protein
MRQVAHEPDTTTVDSGRGDANHSHSHHPPLPLRSSDPGASIRFTTRLRSGAQAVRPPGASTRRLHQRRATLRGAVPVVEEAVQPADLVVEPSEELRIQAVRPRARFELVDRALSDAVVSEGPQLVRHRGAGDAELARDDLADGAGRVVADREDLHDPPPHGVGEHGERMQHPPEHIHPASGPRHPLTGTCTRTGTRTAQVHPLRQREATATS